MTKIAFAAAAILVATGSAFAGGDRYTPVNTNHPTAAATTNVDTMSTASIGKLFTAPAGHATTGVPSDPSQRFWGH